MKLAEPLVELNNKDHLETDQGKIHQEKCRNKHSVQKTIVGELKTGEM